MRRGFRFVEQRISITLLSNAKRLAGTLIERGFVHLHKRYIATGVDFGRATQSPDDVNFSKTRLVQRVVRNFLRLSLLHKSILKRSIKFLKLFLNYCLILADSIREYWLVVGFQRAVHTVHCIIGSSVVQVPLFFYDLCSSKSQVYVFIHNLRWFQQLRLCIRLVRVRQTLKLVLGKVLVKWPVWLTRLRCVVRHRWCR